MSPSVADHATSWVLAVSAQKPPSVLGSAMAGTGGAPREKRRLGPCEEPMGPAPFPGASIRSMHGWSKEDAAAHIKGGKG